MNFLLFCLISLAAIQTPSVPQQPPRSLDVRKLMTVSEFQAAGLTKLSEEEIAALNRWVDVFAQRVLNPGASAKTPEVIESQIDGTFNGWNGETIFKLTNGQIWQQSSYAYTYHYAYRPDVLIYRSGSGYKMKVEDVDDTISVKRIR